MANITINDLEDSRDLDKQAFANVRGGWWMPYYNPYSRYAYGYGGFNNVFQRGSFGFGVQAATFGMQASFDTQNANWLANF